MAITLAEAKATLSTYVDNGVYPTDDRVIARINEAQRRLYAVRTWLGLMAKFSVAVSSTPPYTFTLPDYTGGGLNSFGDFGLTTVFRVSTTQLAPGFLNNTEQAFLTDNTSLVKVSRLSSSSDFRQYQVSGINPIPSFVEVTGKLQFQPATLSTDLLIIQDLDALRLMLLGLWREQNGQLELAQTFETKAVERLSIVLDKTLEGARRVTYQSKVSGSQQGTMGYMRARMALDLKDGLHTDDAVLFHAIDRAEEHLMTKGKWFGTIKQFVVDVPATGEIYLPTEVDAVLFASFDSNTVNLFAREYDFHENGPGYRTAGNSEHERVVVIDRGEEFVFDSLIGDTVPKRKYFVVKPDENEPTYPLTILAKTRFVPKQNDNSYMTIQNYPALVEMVTAFMQTEKPDFFTFHENKAVELLRAELLEKRGGARLTMQIQGEGFAMGEIPYIL
jgi:hypothetical protein